MNEVAERTNQQAALAQRAYRIRRYALRMGEVQGQGYIGQALGMSDILATAHAPVVLALGPEGGFEPEERDAFEAAGWRGASLGSNVLRFETAAIAALALTRALLKTT